MSPNPATMTTPATLAGAPLWRARLAGALLAVSLLLLVHAYHGIWHDSAIYAGQALAVLYPDAFAHDLFFAYGSQAKFSVFPALLAQLTRHIGLGDSFLWLTLAGLLAFLSASWRLLSQLLPGPARLPGLLCLILLPASYGAWGILSYAEPFLTGRSLAEPLALAALAALICQRHWQAIVLGGLALALHPLQALPAAVIAWCWLVQLDRRWLHLAWLIPAAMTACVLLPRLHTIAMRMDALWFQQVWQRSLVVFYSHSSAGDWLYLLKDIFVVAVAAPVAGTHLRRFLLAVLTASLTLLAAGLLLADVLHLAWPAALQLWRGHWLLHWAATAILPWLFMRLRSQQAEQWPRLLILASTVILGLIPTAAHPLLPVLALLYLAWPWLDRHTSPLLLKSLALAGGLLALGYLLSGAIALTPWGMPDSNFRWVDALQQPRLPAILLLPVVLAALWRWNFLSVPMRWLALALLGSMLLLSVNRWDQRSPLQRAFTEQPPNAHPFGLGIAPDAQVLWLGNLLPAWSVLHRAHYIQQQQLSGIVFNRDTSIEGYRRRELLHVQDGQGNDCRIVVFPKEPFSACKPDAAAVRQACINTQGALTYFVLHYPLKVPARGTWTPGNQVMSTYYLYACRDFMNSLAGSAGPTTATSPHVPTH